MDAAAVATAITTTTAVAAGVATAVSSSYEIPLQKQFTSGEILESLFLSLAYLENKERKNETPKTKN